MTGDDPRSDAEWDRRERGETPTERLDRNWGDLLQELRVVQTGVQLLTGLLLTVPFQQRFTVLTDPQRILYLVTLSLSAGAAALLVAPVAVHRLLFRQHARRSMVAAGQRYAIGGLAMLGFAVAGVIGLIFAVVLGNTAAWIAGAAALAIFGTLWAVIPLVQRHRVRAGRS